METISFKSLQEIKKADDVYRQENKLRQLISDNAGIRVTIDHHNYVGFRYIDDYNNCKHVILANIQGAIEGHTGATVETMKAMFRIHNKLTFTVSLNNRHSLNLLKKNFSIIAENPVPIGYSRKMQYHAIFFCFNKKEAKKEGWSTSYYSRARRFRLKNSKFGFWVK